MDATQRFRDRVHALLALGLASPHVASVLGIRGVSEVWGGATPLDLPAWYLWLHGTPGAYRLSLGDAEARGDAAVARFALRYYPARTEAAFATFSFEERAFLLSDAFDETCTPRIDRAHEIPDDLFGVGALEIATGADGLEELAFATMDRLCVRYEADAAFHYAPLGIEIAHHRGEVARDVPGWRIGAPLFRALAGLQAHADQRRPLAITVSAVPGLEHVYGGSAFEYRAARGIRLCEAVARFGGASRRDGGEHTWDSALTLDLGSDWWALAEQPHATRATCCSCCG